MTSADDAQGGALPDVSLLLPDPASCAVRPLVVIVDCRARDGHLCDRQQIVSGRSCEWSAALDVPPPAFPARPSVF